MTGRSVLPLTLMLLSGVPLALGRTAAGAAEAVSIPTNVASLAPVPATSGPSIRYFERADIERMLEDPAIRNHVGIAENTWDFNAPNGVPGFGALPAQR